MTWHPKFSLPVAIRVSKTRKLKLPNIEWALRKWRSRKQHRKWSDSRELSNGCLIPTLVKKNQALRGCVTAVKSILLSFTNYLPLLRYAMQLDFNPERTSKPHANGLNIVGCQEWIR